MALPTIVKTYEYSVNNTNAAAGTDLENFRRVLYGIKTALIGFATLPWTVVGSCDSAAAGMDAVDRWAAYTNLVWNTSGNARSWIVLKNTGLAANFQMLLALTAVGATNEYFMEIVVSPSAGFTGSSTTARPTATDEVVVHTSGQNWIGSFTAPFASAYHVLKSTDGEVTRWIICYNNLVVGHFSIEKAADPVTGWTLPIVITHDNLATVAADHTAYARMYAGSIHTMSFLGTVPFDLFWSSESCGSAGANGSVLNAVSNEFSSEWMLGAVGVVSPTVGYRGRHGRLHDVWWASAFHENGTTFPAGGTRTHAVFGDIVVPWNGTTPVII